MKCPNCGTKYKGKKCPSCGRHTDPSLESKRNTKIALLITVLIFIGICLFYAISVHNYFYNIILMIRAL